MSDWELLQQYRADHASDAMRQLIARHIDMVYATARRAAPDLADDITQAVFLILLRRAPSLSPRIILGGWLFKVTLYAAADARKQQQRRQRHEREAAAMRPTTATPSTSNTWDAIRPALNDALQHLPTSDRDLIILRYLEGRTTADIARDLAAPDGTIRQRLSRALQRLRARLARRGITTTDEALSAALLLAHTPGTAAALLSTISALAAGAAPSTASLTLAQGALKLMAITKTQLIAASAAAVLVLSAGTYIILTRNAPAVPAVAVGPTPTPTTITTTPDTLLAAQPAPQSASQPAPATQTGWPRTTPKTAILAAYHDAQIGDANGFLDSFNNLTDAQTADLRKIITLFSTFHDLQQAATDRFGPEAGAQLGQMATLGVSASDVQGAVEQIDGNTATVDFGNVGPGIIHLIKVGDIWKVDGANFGLPSPAMLTQAEQTLPAVRQLTADIRAGKYATLNDALQTMMKPAPR